MPKLPDSLSWSQEPGRVDIIWAQLPDPQQGAWKLGEVWLEPELSNHSGSLHLRAWARGTVSNDGETKPKCKMSSSELGWTSA